MKLNEYALIFFKRKSPNFQKSMNCPPDLFLEINEVFGVAINHAFEEMKSERRLNSSHGRERAAGCDRVLGHLPC